MTKTTQQRATERQNENRRNKPRLPIVYTTADILQKLDTSSTNEMIDADLASESI